jgi:hypothetical protein
MLNWYLGIGAFLVWLLATLLYMRPSIAAWIARIKHERAIAAEVAAQQRKARK